MASNNSSKDSSRGTSNKNSTSSKSRTSSTGNTGSTGSTGYGVEFPRTGLVRIWQIIGDRRRRLAGVMPMAESTWYAGVASKRFPAGIKRGRKMTFWRAEDIWALVESLK